MNCPKCGLTINGSASNCPRCLCKIPKELQNIVPENDEINNTDAGNVFSTPDNTQYSSQQSFNQQQFATNQNPQNVNNGSMFYWIGQVFKKYADFSGRARRKEYWFFVLMTMIIVIFFTIVAEVTGTIFPFILNSLFSMAILIPSWAVLVRRLHDTNRSGVKILMALIPIAGTIILLVYLAQDSTPGDNQYGPCPK